MDKKIIDAKEKILGRLASKVAERLKKGEKIEIINSEKAIVTGDPDSTLENYKQKKERGDRDKGPYFPEAPDRIIKRTVRGMLPKNKTGKEALKRFKAHIGNPGLDGEEEKIKGVDVETLSDRGRKYITLREISDFIGS